MSTPTIECSKLKNGVWEAVVIGSPKIPPQLIARHQQNELQGLELSPTETAGQWLARLPVPSDIMSDGVQTVLITQADTGEVIGSFAVISGDTAKYDLRAELDLLRAELDMLKTVVRYSLKD